MATHEAEKARKWLRTLLLLLVIWDLAIGLYAVFFAGHMQTVIRFAPRPEPLFIRGVGVYWLFAAYFQYLGYRDPEKNLVALHLSVVFRLSAAAIDFAEVFFLLGRPFYSFHYLLLFFVVMNCLIASAIIRFTKKMNLKLWE